MRIKSLTNIIISTLTALQLSCSSVNYLTQDEIRNLISNSSSYKLLTSDMVWYDDHFLLERKVFDTNNNGKADLYFLYNIEYRNSSVKLIDRINEIKNPMYIIVDKDEDGISDVTYRYNGKGYVLYSSKLLLRMRELGNTRSIIK